MKRKILRRIMVLVVAIVLVFAFATTAYAGTAYHVDLSLGQTGIKYTVSINYSTYTHYAGYNSGTYSTGTMRLRYRYKVSTNWYTRATNTLSIGSYHESSSYYTLGEQVLTAINSTDFDGSVQGIGYIFDY